jgi:hypothetical protein
MIRRQIYAALAVVGDTLLYDLGSDMRTIKRRIVSLEADTRVLEGIVHDGPIRTTYVRREA